jgi:hypothetical protein
MGIPSINARDTTSTTGGWSSGGAAGGWYFNVHGYKMARSIHAEPHTIQLLNGTVVRADRVVYLTTRFGRDGENTTAVAKDLES